MCSLILALCLSSWPTEARWEEGAFAALSVADGLQTAGLADQGRYERMSAALIGRYPSAKSVAATFAIEEVAHAFVEGWLLEHQWRGAARAWELVSLGCEGEAVAWNIHVGVRF